MAKKVSILFVCTGNSARSQMAEGFARYYGGDRVAVDSAGTAPKGTHPHALWAMNEVGIDISHQTSEALEMKNPADYDCVITLCGDARDSCPSLPEGVRSEFWDLPDPATARGKPLEVLQAFRVVRIRIERQVKNLLSNILT